MPHTLFRLTLCAVILTAVGCSSAPPKPDAAALLKYQAEWAEVEGAPAKDATEDDYGRRVALIDSPLFRDLSPQLQYSRLIRTARLSMSLKHIEAAHQWYVRATEMPDADFSAWAKRFESAYLSRDMTDSTHTLTRVAQKWPEALAAFSPKVVDYVAFATADSVSERKARFELLEALYRANWRPYFDVPPGELWGELAMQLTERGQLDRALLIAARVNSPRALLSMRIDRRYDALVRRNPRLFDVAGAADRQIEDWLIAVDHYPHALECTVHLAGALLDAGRYQDALRTATAVMMRLNRARRFSDVYADDETGVNSILDDRAQALTALGKWNDAEWDLRTAADRREHDHPNIDNVIDLAEFYADLGKGDLALQALAELPETESDLSPYGRMQWHAARVEAALESNEATLAEKSLEYLQAHGADSYSAYQFALVRANRLDDAATVLIRRLRDPMLRNEALMEVQIYEDPPAPAAVEAARSRWRTVVGRADVQREIARVGRIERVPLPSEWE